MKSKLEDSVIEEVRKAFSSRDQDAAIDLIANAELWCPESGPPPRVHLAFIMSADGNIEILRNTIISNQGDWRDLLVETGLGNENWRHVLQMKGIDCSKW